MATRPQDYTPYWKAWEARLARAEAQRRARAEARRSAADAVLPVLVDRLLRGYGVRRVLLIGSLARGDVGPDSDIDLVVEGLPADALFRAGAELERLAGEIPVDLVPLESASDRLRAAVEREGVVVGER